MISLLDGQGPGKKKVPEKVFALRLDVAGTTPRIWRQVLVRESMWLSRLHDTIQILFDWFDYQTHAFNLDDLRFGNPVKRDDMTIEDDRDITLADLDLEHRGRLTYDYHFGDVWRVDIKVEKVLTVQKGQIYPLCAGGERAGPPEDCGGLEAFHDMLACIKEPDTDLGREWREWLGPEYTPERCDLERINKALRKLLK
jgi:hypothetical protein